MQNIPEIYNSLRKSFDSGLTLDLNFRISQLRALYRMLDENEDVITDALYKDLKKPKQESILTEIVVVKGSISHMLNHIHELSEPEQVYDRPIIFAGETTEVRKVPHGVVLIVGAWNFPVQLAVNPLVGAIAAGNTSIVKFSEIAEHTANLFFELFPKYLDQRCVRIVEGGVAEATKLLELNFDMICYTGSTQVGKIYHSAAAKNFTPVLLELGGKSPVVIDSTVDPEIAAKRILYGKIMNAGQVCIAPDYVLVHKNVAPKFIKAFGQLCTEMLTDLSEESPFFARIINDNHFKRVTGLIEKSKKEGAQIAFGGHSNHLTRFIEPTLITGITHDFDKFSIMKEEIFGPVLPVVEFDSIDEAIALIKKIGDHPLAFYPFSNSPTNTEKLIDSINCGMVCANDTMVNAAVHDLPFGGVKESGLGSYHGIHSFNAFSRSKTVVIRNIKFDFHNLIRYVNHSGDYNWFAAKVVRFVVGTSMPSDTYLKAKNIYRKLGGVSTIIKLLVFLVGIYFGKRI